MTEANGRRSAQGGRTKPSFEYKPIPVEEGKPGQSEKDLGARWGVGKKSGPRTSRRRPSTPQPPGGLGTGTVPNETDSRQESLDQPNLGSDRPPETPHDQASEAADLQESLDQSSRDDSDRPGGRAFVFYHHHLVVFPRSDPLALWVGWSWYGPKQQVQGDPVTLEKSSPNQSTWVGVQPRLHHLFPLSSTPSPMRSRQP